MKNFIKFFCCIVLFWFQSNHLQAQNIEWAKSGGGSQYNTGISIVCDQNGNSYVTGYFEGTLNMNGQVISSQGAHDIFIAKYSNSGNIIWLKDAGGSGSDVGNSIDIDLDGNVYITGSFKQTAIFDSITLTASSPNFPCGFIAKYNSSGNILWAKSIGTVFSSIDVDSVGNSYITGTSGILYAKYDKNGQLIFVKNNSNPNPIGQAILCNNQGEVYIAGQFSCSLTIDSINLVSNSYHDVFLAKIGANGILEWVIQGKAFGFYNYCCDLAIDDNNNIYLTGFFEDSLSFGSNDTLFSNSTYSFGFIAKISQNGIVNKLIGFNSNDSQQSCGQSISVMNNDILVCGAFVNHVKIDTADLYSQGGQYDDDFFIAIFNDSLMLKSIKQVGGSNSQQSYSLCNNNQNIFFTGFCEGITHFDTINITSNSLSDIFIAKLNYTTSSVNESTLINLYPNPSNGIVSVSINDPLLIGSNLELLDLSGNVIYKTKISSTKFQIDFSGQNNGIYLIKLNSNKIKQSLYKLVKIK